MPGARQAAYDKSRDNAVRFLTPPDAKSARACGDRKAAAEIEKKPCPRSAQSQYAFAYRYECEHERQNR